MKMFSMYWTMRRMKWRRYWTCATCEKNIIRRKDVIGSNLFFFQRKLSIEKETFRLFSFFTSIKERKISSFNSSHLDFSKRNLSSSCKDMNHFPFFFNDKTNFSPEKSRKKRRILWAQLTIVFWKVSGEVDFHSMRSISFSLRIIRRNSLLRRTSFRISCEVAVTVELLMKREFSKELTHFFHWKYFDLIFIRSTFAFSWSFRSREMSIKRKYFTSFSFDLIWSELLIYSTS